MTVDDDMEQRLRDRLTGEPSAAALRSRILNAVEAELARPAATPRRASGSLTFVSGIAAAVLIAVNLSQTASSVTPVHSRPITRSAQALAGAQSLKGLTPDLSEAEATRMFALLELGGNLEPLPWIRPMPSSASHGSISSNLERTVQ